MVLLFSRPRRRIFALPGNDLCIFGLDIMALIGFSPQCAAGLLGSWPHCLALRPIQVFVEPGLRYQRVRELVRVPDGLDIKGFCRAGRPSGVRLDIVPTISILAVCGSGVC